MPPDIDKCPMGSESPQTAKGRVEIEMWAFLLVGFPSPLMHPHFLQVKKMGQRG
jgi:hypothetical protein